MLEIAVSCIGFCCFFATCPFSFFGTSPQLMLGMSWQEIALARCAFLAASSASFLGGRFCAQQRLLVPLGWPDEAVLGRRQFAFAFAGGVLVMTGFATLVFCVALPAAIRSLVYGMALGVGMATLGNCWFHEFLRIRRLMDRTTCMLGLTLSFLLTVVLTWLLMLARPSAEMQVGFVAVLVAGSLACLAAVVFALVGKPERTVAHPVTFGVTRYAKTMLLAMGVSWSQAFDMNVELGYGAGPERPIVWAATITACIALLGLGVFATRRVDVGRLRFGFLMRWFLTMLGCWWVVLPVATEMAPIVAEIVLCMVFWSVLSVFLVFAMEVSLERHLPFGAVLPPFISTFFMGALAGVALYVGAKALLGATWQAYTLVSASAAVAALLVMPMMPDRTSDAHVFTLEVSPQGVDDNAGVDALRRDFIESYGLTPREANVFDLLMRGMTREQIADELTISPLTVKNHIRSILEKTNTRSARELMAFVYERSR